MSYGVIWQFQFSFFVVFPEFSVIVFCAPFVTDSDPVWLEAPFLYQVKLAVKVSPELSSLIVKWHVKLSVV